MGGKRAGYLLYMLFWGKGGEDIWDGMILGWDGMEDLRALCGGRCESVTSRNSGFVGCGRANYFGGCSPGKAAAATADPKLHRILPS